MSILLQPYKEPVGTVAGVVTIAQFFSGAFICKDIYKKGSTDGISSNPFVGGIVMYVFDVCAACGQMTLTSWLFFSSGLLMLKYSFILDDNVMLYVNISAIVLNVLYLLFYYVYARVRRDLFKSMSVGAGVIGVMLGYAFLERPDRLEYRFGLVVTVLMLLLLGSPLFEVVSLFRLNIPKSTIAGR